METLAINGGKKALDYKIPSWNDITGRDIGEEEKKLVMEVLDSGSLGMVCGKKVKILQKRWAEKCGVDTAVAVSSGTASLHTALIYACIGAGDEVLVPCATDMGTVISILLQNAIPVFVDIDPITQNIDVQDMERKITPRTKAVIVVHMFGYPCDMDGVMAVARAKNLIVVEDCCQAHFARYKGKLVGTIGDIGCFSFQQTKHVTAGEGGMVITDGDSKYSRALQLCGDKGWPRDKYREHYFLAPNYHMTDLQAAVALAQLEKVDKGLINRRESGEALTDAISGIDGVLTPPKSTDDTTHTFFAYQFAIEPDKFKASRDDMVKAMVAEGLDILPSYLPKPLYHYDFLQKIIMYNSTKCPIDCKHYHGQMDYTKVFCEKAEHACKTGFFIHWNEKMTPQISEDIARVIKKVFEYYHI